MRYRLALPLLLLVLAVYLPSFRAHPFDDDYSAIRDGDVVRTEGIASAFPRAQVWGWYRPIRAVAAAYTTAPSLLPWAPHLLNLALHAGCALLLFAVARRLLPGSNAPLLATFLFAFSQANAMAVLSVDGFSELGVTAAWLGGTFAIVRAADGSALSAALSLGLFLLGLLTKESMVAFPLVVLAAALLPGAKARMGRLALLHFLLLFLFLFFRDRVAGAVPPDFSADGEGYRFLLGPSTLRNAALFLLSLSTPISSVRLAAQGGSRAALLALLFSVFLLAAVGFGLRASVRRGRPPIRTAFFLLAWLAASSLPNLLLAHVSELYSYRLSGPFFVIAAAALAGPLFERAGSALRVAAFLWLSLNLYAIHEKEAGIREAGERAERVLRAVRESVPDPAPSAHFHLYDEWGEYRRRPYSVFAVPGALVFRSMFDYALNRAYGRADLTATVDPGPDIDRVEAERRAPGRYVFRFRVDRDQVERADP